MSPVGYLTMVAGKSEVSKTQLRLEMVRYAQRRGIREAMRAFRSSRNTVRVWKRRYEAEGMRGLADRSRAPKRIPHKTSAYLEARVVEARETVPCYGPERLKRFFRLKPSEGAIGRILRERKLTRKPRKKYQKKQDLREVKARYRALSHHQMDVKHLNDIPRYWLQMEQLGLPRYEYTIRDTKSGAVCLAYARELSVKFSEMAVSRYADHLRDYGIEPSELIVQTDGGPEFSGGVRKKTDRGFVHHVEEVLGAQHVFIPPGCCNANADVESFHALVEHEFYDLEDFTGVEDFLDKAYIYQNFFNFVRPNSYKGGKTPWDIIEAERPGISPRTLLLPPVIIDDLYDRVYNSPSRLIRVGQHVPAAPALFQMLVDYCNYIDN